MSVEWRQPEVTEAASVEAFASRAAQTHGGIPVLVSSRSSPFPVSASRSHQMINCLASSLVCSKNSVYYRDSSFSLPKLNSDSCFIQGSNFSS